MPEDMHNAGNINPTEEDKQLSPLDSVMKLHDEVTECLVRITRLEQEKAELRSSLDKLNWRSDDLMTLIKRELAAGNKTIKIQTVCDLLGYCYELLRDMVIREKKLSKEPEEPEISLVEVEDEEALFGEDEEDEEKAECLTGFPVRMQVKLRDGMTICVSPERYRELKNRCKLAPED